MPKRVLITGHNGYIGSVMAPYFAQRVMRWSAWIPAILARVRWSPSGPSSLGAQRHS